MPFDGLRVLSLESQRAAEIEKLICARGCRVALLVKQVLTAIGDESADED